jgi:hypothetical protein
MAGAGGRGTQASRPWRRRGSTTAGTGTWMLGLSLRQYLMVWLLFLAVLWLASTRHGS